MSYRYIKAPPGYTLRRRRPGQTVLKITFSSLLLTLGITAFTSVAYPMIVYQYRFAPRFTKTTLETPVVLGVTNTVKANEAPPAPAVLPEIVNTSLDYTNSNTWFAGKAKSAVTDPIVFNFSIPKLGIKDATVRNDHTDLKQSLILYPGTASPGDLGNAVIFGHSVLPQFFNPKNYLTIFSTLHTLTPGETINITFGPATYTYKIIDMYQTHPDDLSPLAQSYDNRYLTLITCTPPGTYLRRLIIKAVLI